MKKIFFIFLPSTWFFIKEGYRTRGYSLKNWLHGYIYIRWIYLYLSIGTGNHFVARKLKPLTLLLQRIFKTPKEDINKEDNIRFADTYHGKVLCLEEAKQLVTVNKKIEIVDLEQVIPYKEARSIVLENPDHIVLMACPCRKSRPNPCKPLDVCLVIGEPFSQFVLEHHPDRCRKISQQDAIAVLEAEHQRGHVHHAFFKTDMLGRFYAICNCCGCCCGAINAWRNGTPMLASSGYIRKVAKDRCVSCGICAKFCQFGAISKEGEDIIFDESLCLGCGVCVTKCKKKALTLERDPARGEPLEINKLTNNE